MTKQIKKQSLRVPAAWLLLIIGLVALVQPVWAVCHRCAPSGAWSPGAFCACPSSPHCYATTGSDQCLWYSPQNQTGVTCYLTSGDLCYAQQFNTNGCYSMDGCN